MFGEPGPGGLGPQGSADQLDYQLARLDVDPDCEQRALTAFARIPSAVHRYRLDARRPVDGVSKPCARRSADRQGRRSTRDRCR